MKHFILLLLMMTSLSASADQTPNCTINGHKAIGYLKAKNTIWGPGLMLVVDCQSISCGWSLLVGLTATDGKFHSVTKDPQGRYQDSSFKQVVQGNQVISEYLEPNEKNEIKMELNEAHTKVKSVKVRQKIYDGVLDLLFPLNVNRVKCQF